MAPINLNRAEIRNNSVKIADYLKSRNTRFMAKHEIKIDPEHEDDDNPT